MRRLIGFASIGVGAALLESAAFAGLAPTPAPLVAAGIPALIAIGGGYALARRRRG